MPVLNCYLSSLLTCFVFALQIPEGTEGERGRDRGNERDRETERKIQIERDKINREKMENSQWKMLPFDPCFAFLMVVCHVGNCALQKMSVYCHLILGSLLNAFTINGMV